MRSDARPACEGSRRQARPGSRLSRNAFFGRPPHCSLYIALWPAAQMPRGSVGITLPVMKAGHESAIPPRRRPPRKPSGPSACSAGFLTKTTRCCRCRRTSPDSRRRASGLLGDLGRLGDAGVVLPQPGLGGQLLRNAGFMASGVPWRSTGSGVEPVVSTPMPTTFSAEKSRSVLAAETASLTDLKKPSM